MLTNSAAFQKAARKAFKECDLDANGRVDHKEVIIGLLKVYDKINAKLPGCHVEAPRRQAMLALIKKYDKNGDGYLSEKEFLELAAALVFQPRSWRESLLWTVGSVVFLRLVVYPLAAVWLIAAARGWYAAYHASSGGVSVSGSSGSLGSKPAAAAAATISNKGGGAGPGAPAPLYIPEAPVAVALELAVNQLLLPLLAAGG